MAGFTLENTLPITDPNILGDAIVAALTSADTTTWFEEIIAGPLVTQAGAVEKYLLESTEAIDAYLTTEPTQTYRMLITFTVDLATTKYTSMTIQMGNELQLALNNDNTDVISQNGVMTITVFNAGNLPTLLSEYNYRMTLTDRGFALFTWKTSNVNKVASNVLLVVQRPVNPTSGETKITGNAPIFALWHNANSTSNFFNWGVVREKDKSASAAIGTTDTVSRYNMYRVTLEWSHPNLFDNNSHVVKFPYGFATSRHLYLDELDLVCVVNATAFASKQDVKITMYGEEDERTYKTSWGEVSYGNIIGVQSPQAKVVSGARIGILAENGGI